MLHRKVLIPTAVFLWFLAIVSGGKLLGSYRFTPGQSETSLSSWPTNTQLQRENGALTLLVFLHPECPCSKATVEELDRLLADLNRPVSVSAVFFQPEQWDSQRVMGALWDRVGRIPGVLRFIDKDGVESKNFGVSTSGHLLAFSGNGILEFSGGITPGRGHMGESEGQLTLMKLINSGQNKTKKYPVFGCSLRTMVQ